MTLCSCGDRRRFITEITEKITEDTAASRRCAEGALSCELQEKALRAPLHRAVVPSVTPWCSP